LTTPDSLLDLMRKRRAIYPAAYIDQAISTEIINQVLEAARWAPTHKRTEPWRFVVMHSAESRAKLGLHMAEHYKSLTTEAEYSEVKYQKPIKSTAQAGCIIAIILHTDTDQRLPEWEEMCAVASAVQNMWLTTTALGLGSYWSTHGSIATAQELLHLQPNQRCIGYFFMGHTDAEKWPVMGQRKEVEEVAVWV
jgi:nitroreductase